MPTHVKRTAVTAKEGNGAASLSCSPTAHSRRICASHACAFPQYDRCGEEVGGTELRAGAGGFPAARLALVGAAEQGERRAGEDLQVEPRRAVLDVPDVELDALVPRQRGAAVDLRPA